MTAVTAARLIKAHAASHQSLAIGGTVHASASRATMVDTAHASLVRTTVPGTVIVLITTFVAATAASGYVL